MKTNELKMKSLRIVPLLVATVFSLTPLQAQQPDHKTLFTEKDGFQWYYYQYETGAAAFDLNGKQLTCICNYLLSYEDGYFDASNKYGFDIVHAYYSKQGKCITNNASTYDNIVVDNKYLIYKEYKEDHRGYFGIYDLENDRQILGLHYYKIGVIRGSNGELFFKPWMDNYHYGIYDISGEEILAPEFEYCDYMGSNLFKFKMNGYMGVMNREGKIIIPLDRHYTSIDYSRTLKIFTFTKETETAYYKGECNASGVQTSIEKTGTKSKPKQQTQQPKQETKPQQPKQESKPKQETTPTPQPQPQPQPQPRPMQVWKPCPYCQGSGKCHVCLGDGHPLQNPTGRCITCNGTGKCSHCAGNGGQNVIEYH